MAESKELSEDSKQMIEILLGGTEIYATLSKTHQGIIQGILIQSAAKFEIGEKRVAQ